ncbi:hypothetical protein MRB53_040188 [Persea americana]|nr:hypothetical protein MRB53_040188 [Persea americana]
MFGQANGMQIVSRTEVHLNLTQILHTHPSLLDNLEARIVAPASDILVSKSQIISQQLSLASEDFAADICMHDCAARPIDIISECRQSIEARDALKDDHDYAYVESKALAGSFRMAISLRRYKSTLGLVSAAEVMSGSIKSQAVVLLQARRN